MFETFAHEYQNEHNVPTEVIERQMGHKDGNKIRAVYNHAENLKERFILMQWWADFLDRIKNHEINQ